MRWLAMLDYFFLAGLETVITLDKVQENVGCGDLCGILEKWE